jgi:AraC family transcriptional regulator
MQGDTLKRSVSPDLTGRRPPAAPSSTQGEQAFWFSAKAEWKRLAGDFFNAGFSFEWHELEAGASLEWGSSFHPGSVEVCLNLEGRGWVSHGGTRIEYEPETSGFFVLNGARPAAQRLAGQRHQFLTVEYSLVFLRERLASHRDSLHSKLWPCIDGTGPATVLWPATPLTHRHRELLNSLLRPPVLKAAQRLWYESKALEFAAEFLFSAGDQEPLCSRAQKLAAERVSKAKELLRARLADPPSLEELGRQVGCSHFYLSRTFTRETGLTISQWLRRARLERAAELLRLRKCNVTEAALEVGYSSLSHFSQAFHEMHGCCPGLYPLRTPSQPRPPQN